MEPLVKKFLEPYRAKVKGMTFFGIPIEKFDDPDDLRAMLVFVEDEASKASENHSRAVDLLAGALNWTNIGRRR